MSVQQAGTDIRVLRELEEFPLVEALFGRRSRRFARGGEIPDGPLAYRSVREPGSAQRTGTDAGPRRHGRDDGMAFLDHPARPLHAARLGAAPRSTTPAFKTCVARQAQYVFDTFGKFPGTVPSVFIMNYVQAHHLDPGFTTGSSNPAHTCARTPSICNAGHAGPEGA
jgi:hypothetical protein